jgi:hypothetical protein
MSMDEPIRNHLEAIDTARDVPRLLRAGPVADSTHPVALEWVRRWGPSRAAIGLPFCACAAGRCACAN